MKGPEAIWLANVPELTVHLYRRDIGLSQAFIKTGTLVLRYFLFPYESAESYFKSNISGRLIIHKYNIYINIYIKCLAWMACHCTSANVCR